MRKVYCSKCMFLTGRYDVEFCCTSLKFCECGDTWYHPNAIIKYGDCKELNKNNECAGYRDKNLR